MKLFAIVLCRDGNRRYECSITKITYCINKYQVLADNPSIVVFEQEDRKIFKMIRTSAPSV